MNASERFDAALRDFRQSLDLLEEPGRPISTVFQRRGRRLYLVRVTQCWASNTGPNYSPAYFTQDLRHH
jgi:hypothetical protein